MVFNSPSIHCFLVPLNLPSSNSKNEQHTAYVHSYFSKDQKSGRSPSFCSCQSAICQLKDVSWYSEDGQEKLIWHANAAFIQWFQILKIDRPTFNSEVTCIWLFNAYKIMTKHIIKQILNPEQYSCGILFLIYFYFLQ